MKEGRKKEEVDKKEDGMSGGEVRVGAAVTVYSDAMVSATGGRAIRFQR